MVLSILCLPLHCLREMCLLFPNSVGNSNRLQGIGKELNTYTDMHIQEKANVHPLYPIIVHSEKQRDSLDPTCPGNRKNYKVALFPPRDHARSFVPSTTLFTD